MSAPSHVPTPVGRRVAAMLAANGVVQDDIAKVIGICPKTLRKHYRRELRRGAIVATVKVAAALMKTAAEGEGREAVTAAIFWLRTRARWSELR